MHVLLIVLGLLLVLFGGGCTLIIGGFAIADFRNTVNDLGTVLPMFVAMGLAPLAAGIFLMRAGMKRDREKRAAPRDGDVA